MSEKKIPLNCRIPVELKLALEKQGQARGLTLTDVVVEALNARLVNNNGGAVVAAPPKDAEEARLKLDYIRLLTKANCTEDIWTVIQKEVQELWEMFQK